MNKNKFISLNIFLISFSVVCFEIISTRISSVIFVNNYAFIILSFAILGLGSGGIFSYYRGKENISRPFVLFCVSLCIFIVSIIRIPVTSPFLYFTLLFLPFFFAGMVYARVFELYAKNSFMLYAADLLGGALGSVASLGFIRFLGASNSVLFLALIGFASTVSFFGRNAGKLKIAGVYSIFFLTALALLINGRTEFLGMVPIGYFPEKDYYHVYQEPNIQSRIVDSRWSIYGRADLAEYNHQDVVKQLFIDGAAGTQMYRFNGNIKKPGLLLFNLLIRHSISIPFLFLTENEKNSMLIIGPGGGKEVLIGLSSGVGHITGVEINPDFIDIVKAHRNFNGGIYTDFPDVNIQAKEGRHFVKQSRQFYDLIIMALPSTEQLQNIEAFAMSENYLLTTEALEDYMKHLTPEGRLMFTVHNQWELLRLVTTAITALHNAGISPKDALNHFAIVESENAPTLVIKKNAFTKTESAYWLDMIHRLPVELPPVTYLPFCGEITNETPVNQLLRYINRGKGTLQEFIHGFPYDISPSRDDSPFFYKVNRGIPNEYLWLVISIAAFVCLMIVIPLKRLRTEMKKTASPQGTLLLMVFLCTGIGFMILEITLFQKLILYLGSPTVSLSVLLSSLLAGMGSGSIWGKNIYKNNHRKRLSAVCLLIVLAGAILFIFSPILLSLLLEFSPFIRAGAAFLLLLPFGFLLGIPFPTALHSLQEEKQESFIPWMYGINGSASVFGSVLAVILSMLLGFTPTFFIGLAFYILLFVLFYTLPVPAGGKIPTFPMRIKEKHT